MRKDGSTMTQTCMTRCNGICGGKRLDFAPQTITTYSHGND